ncbi:MAG: type I-F CRISPR-associated helicase Cas3f [Marinomonas foliarum]|uniref:type I-F CRISPR-associated helicase Cas3f n=1 Tax=Marinomonas foliarum TaxID=491950 RepID=UPI003F9CD776
MNILLVSQCSKKALKETRRVIDQFAERTGDRTWQTAITEQGLATLRKLLKKTARRNTSVACHWIRGRNRTELKWLVGNPRRFNEWGSVPTNVTGRDILRSGDENTWQTAEDIRVLAGIAALFHDFGKANKAFQEKLKPSSGKKKKTYEPYRHEWVSVRLFEAFVLHAIEGVDKGKQDAAWLTLLSDLPDDIEGSVMARLKKDGIDVKVSSPFKYLPPVAKAVAWLILSHHKLPEPVKDDTEFVNSPETIIDEGYICANWNSPQCDNKEWKLAEIAAVWFFEKGSPFCSKVWRERISRIASQGAKRTQLLAQDWLNQPFSLHLARLSLMLGDHYYSSQKSIGPKSPWHDDKGYKKVYANTWRERGSRDNGNYNQTLDEHLIGVYRHSHQIVRSLSSLKESLPVITRHPELKKRTLDSRFAWQNKAYELAVSVRNKAKQHGFFGVNVASTGKGKTFANARIMYGLADDRKGCRFSVALGLRTLTLQTGDAFKELLRLDDEDLGVLIGSKAVKDLHEQAKTKQVLAEESQQEVLLGSESANDFSDQDSYVSYEGMLGDGPLSRWLENAPKNNKLVNAPVLVSTIDHLMPSTEGSRGGKQIAPMLRLLTSDLVLDEPDDFGLEDLPALCRLVNWAGMLGSNVLLSSATLPPDLINALFDAYLAGRKQYEASVKINPSQTPNVVCAWFDEFRSDSIQASECSAFSEQHQKLMVKRAEKLLEQSIKRRVELVECHSEGDESSVIQAVVQRVHQSILALHNAHHHKHPTLSARASFGLVRMANINPLVAVAKALMNAPSPEGIQIHYCVYHSQFLLLQRSAIEQMLDTVLNRKDPNAIWHQPSVNAAIKAHPNDQHIFVVLGSPVTEVGRDHSYDWAVVEPSSIRSLIQLAGRVLRHSDTTVEKSNIHLLNQNVRAMKNEKAAYTKPGFEGNAFLLDSHKLQDLLEANEYQTINALPRIQKRDLLAPTKRFVDLEHAALHSQLWGKDKEFGEAFASLWWNNPCHWTNLLQRKLPFRRHTPDEFYCFYIEEEYDEPTMHRWHDNGELKADDKQSFQRDQTHAFAMGVHNWIKDFDYQSALVTLAEKLRLELSDASIQFGTIRLRKSGENDVWQQSAVLGFYKNI